MVVPLEVYKQIGGFATNINLVLQKQIGKFDIIE